MRQTAPLVRCRRHVLAGSTNPRYVLVALGPADILKVLNWLRVTPELAQAVGSLELGSESVSGGQDFTSQLNALCDVLWLCTNLDSLSINVPLYLESFVEQLLQQHSGGFPKLRSLRFSPQCTIPPRCLLKLLRAMPNLQRLERVPRIPGENPVVAADLASCVRPIAFRYLELGYANGDLVLPLLSGLWVARTVHLKLTHRLLNALENYDGPSSDLVGTTDMTLHYWAMQSPGPATSWVARTCVALRSLRVGAHDEYIVLILAPLLNTGGFRLRELTLHCVITDAALGDHFVMRLAALLLSAPPALATLRALQIYLTSPTLLPYGHLLHEVRVMCRERRIVYSLAGPCSRYAAPGTMFPQSWGWRGPRTRRRCCWML